MDEIGKVREVEIAGVLTLITLPVESACEVIDEKRREAVDSVFTAEFR